MSDEFEVSLKTGANVLLSLPKDKYVGVDILVGKDGEWHVGGVPKTVRQARAYVDVIFNALHGGYGEDGKMAQLLDNHHIPYTGSGALAASMAMHKPLAKEALRRAGLKVPPGIVLEDYRDSTIVGQIPQKIRELAEKIFKNVPSPWVLKPARGGSSINTYVAKDWKELIGALASLFSYGGDIVVEQYIAGKEVSAGVIEGFRSSSLYTPIPVEVRHSGAFFDYASKQSPEFAVPPSLSAREKEEVAELAKVAHETLGLRDYSVADFIVTPRGVYILEVNNNPGLTQSSILPKSLEAVGAKLSDFVDHLVTLAMERK
ncbi:ATP-grasp domain-containing protein [Candidatus Parcubacteria bacterium]|nr:ATP-grasp domain-containing protein [Candidatus Parcubacteria bacterium]